MKAVCWQGSNKVGVETVPDPKIINSRDAVVKITTSAICGSDLHLYDGYIPTMEPGDILGHEFMGEVVEKGVVLSRMSTSAIAWLSHSPSPAVTVSSANKS